MAVWHMEVTFYTLFTTLVLIVGDSMYNPQKLDESNAIFTLNMNKNYKNRVRKVDVERHEQLKLAQMQGQGDAVISSRMLFYQFIYTFYRC